MLALLNLYCLQAQQFDTHQVNPPKYFWSVMNASRYITCLWPGLPELWYRGRWSGLPAALMFGVCLNFLIVARFIYPEWLIPALVRVACWIGAGVWIMLVVRSVSQLPALLHPRAVAETADPFPDAQQLYLQGRWEEAEAALTTCLEIDSRDCQAMLLLANVYRQTGRLEAAGRTLDQLSRLETADAWWLELAAEKQRLERYVEAANAESTEAENDAEVSENAAQMAESVSTA